MRKLLTLLVILCLGGAATAYGWLWHQTSSAADQLVAALRPYADADYRRVYVWPRGEAGVQELRIRPHAVGETFRIESVGLRADHLPQLAKSLRALQRGEKPEQLSLVVRGAHLALDGPLMTLLEQQAAQTAARSPEFQLAALACGEAASSGTQALRRMGYQELVSDVTVDVQLHEQSLALRTVSETRNLARVSMDLRLQHDPGLASAADPVRLVEAHLNYHDLGYQSRHNRYCAQYHDDDPQAYIQAHADAAAKLLREQFELRASEELRAAYIRLMQEGASGSLSLRPAQPLVLDHLSWYQPADALALLQPRLFVGGEAVALDALLSRSPTPPREPTQARQQAETQTQAEQQTADKGTGSTATTQRYQAVAVEQLPQYLGRHARVQLHSGERHEGVIESVGERQLRLRRRMRSGSYTFPVALKDIDRTEVWR